MPNDFRAAELSTFAEDIAVQVMDKLHEHMTAHPAEYPDFTSGSARLEAAEKILNQLLGDDAHLVFELIDAHYTRSYVLAVEIYKQGVLDGGRIYHAMTNRELPEREVQDEQ